MYVPLDICLFDSTIPSQLTSNHFKFLSMEFVWVRVRMTETGENKKFHQRVRVNFKYLSTGTVRETEIFHKQRCVNVTGTERSQNQQ